MKKNKSGKKTIAVLILIILIVAGILAVKISKNQEIPQTVAKEKQEETPVPEVKKVQIVNEESKSRPYAVMINNNHSAWPQCGVQDAYLVYEIIAEGGITRMMALFKDKDTAKVGSIRSARHYFLDYVQENDAIFVHWGGSPQAYSKFGSFDNIDGTFFIQFTALLNLLYSFEVVYIG